MQSVSSTRAALRRRRRTVIHSFILSSIQTFVSESPKSLLSSIKAKIIYQNSSRLLCYGALSSRPTASINKGGITPGCGGGNFQATFAFPFLIKQFRGINISRDLEDEKRERDAVVATQIGAVSNIVLALSKGGIGYIMQSTALIADAVHAASDLLTDAVVYFTITEARKAATPDRPWGTGKIEPLGALTIGGLLLATGAGIGYQAGHNVIDIITAMNSSSSPESVTAAAAAVAVENSHALEGMEALIAEMKDGHSSLVHHLALGLTGASIVIKEALFHYTTYVGNKVHSDSVKANAWHHRSDAIVSAAVFVGLAGAMAGYPILDPIAGVIVSGLIVQQGFTTTWDALQDLSDAPASPAETASLKEACLSVPGVLSVETLHARRSGPFLYVECTVGVPGNISASAAHRMAELARTQMMSLVIPGQRKVANALVDVDPLGSAGLGERSPSWARDHDSVARAVEKSLLSMENIISVTEVQVYYQDDGRIKLKVDVSMNPELSIKSAHKLAVLARNRIELDLPGVASVDVDLELDEGYSKTSD